MLAISATKWKYIAFIVTFSEEHLKKKKKFHCEFKDKLWLSGAWFLGECFLIVEQHTSFQVCQVFNSDFKQKSGFALVNKVPV